MRQRLQRSPPSTSAAPLTRWELLPAANRQRLLRLLGRLVERQLPAAASNQGNQASQHNSGEEGPRDAYSHAQ